ncbi:hypothetical protein GDO86_020342 [Hymenochirus boettgeri]|uniref:Neurosecretory protein VGF n=1 Tax=Hymenochirus boettgeri TaxID=247094 RepID=A0A8T2IDC2_9PIPI|nr:hypothetical protein GDO86_020342 [Hymenochirus boettgeri]
MLRVPPLLLTLSLTILHPPLFYAIPLVEEQRHQTVHQDPHTSLDHPSEIVDHQEAAFIPRDQQEKRDSNEVRSAMQMLPLSTPDEGDELFKDISPKALAAVLLQALNTDKEEQTVSTLEERNLPADPKTLKHGEEDGLSEKAKSRTQNSEKEDEIKESEKTEAEERELESVKSLLQELENFQPLPKREQESNQDTSIENEDLEELKELLGIEEQAEEEKRNSIKPDPELSKGWGGDESEKLAGVAQDLLLQYVLNGGRNGEEQNEEEKEQEKGGEEVDDYQGGDFAGGQRPLFEDEEDSNIQKRSWDDDDEVDPQTIDQLIELSSRLHLPADDVVDIINDVEKRRRRRMKKMKARDDLPGRKERTRAPSQTWADKPKPSYYPRRKLEVSLWKKPDPMWNKVPDPSWNKKKESRWNKLSNPSWNKASQQNWKKLQEPSWNKVKEPSWNKVQEPSWNKVQEPSWNKVQEPSWNKVQETSWNKMQEPSWNKVQEPSWNKVQEPSWNKVQEPSWNKVQEPSWNKMQETSWNDVEEPSWKRVQDSGWDSMQDPSWNKPSWKKYMEPVPRRYRPRPIPFSNYIRPRTFQTPPRYYYKPPYPQRDSYFNEDKDRQDEMENYIERMLLTHPEVFQ